MKAVDKLQQRINYYQRFVKVPYSFKEKRWTIKALQYMLTFIMFLISHQFVNTNESSGKTIKYKNFLTRNLP
ncbi:hypothetical protein ATX87_08725 [Oenococcus oeni]|nr:hypothetical protein ATW61_08905 [Oenococcus oeni]OIM62288.1 hypothetical protein ATX87_08725 [Oenococcus oeni]SYW11629.1 hypothetical protein OENI_90032 [Oenococcus oeni]